MKKCLSLAVLTAFCVSIGGSAFAWDRGGRGHGRYYPPPPSPRHYPRNTGGNGVLEGVAIGAAIVILDRLSRPAPQVIVVRERVIEREPTAAPTPKSSDELKPEASADTEKYVHKTYRGYYETAPVRCTEDQLRRNKVQYGTSGWLQVPGDPNTRCYYNFE